jgi:hypothetical protein
VRQPRTLHAQLVEWNVQIQAGLDTACPAQSYTYESAFNLCDRITNFPFHLLRDDRAIPMAR